MTNRLEGRGIIPLLQVESVSKKYGENVVLANIDFSLQAGTVHGVIGQNGAGKSTLVGIISGIVVPDSGDVRVSDNPIEHGSPRAALSAGIATVYQELSLLPELAVYENMFLGDEIVKNRRLDSSEMIEQTRALLSELGGYGIDAASRTWRLSLAQRQIVEIARCVRRNAWTDRRAAHRSQTPRNPPWRTSGSGRVHTSRAMRRVLSGHPPAPAPAARASACRATC